MVLDHQSGHALQQEAINSFAAKIDYSGEMLSNQVQVSERDKVLWGGPSTNG